jgi:hypothetical protein
MQYVFIEEQKFVSVISNARETRRQEEKLTKFVIMEPKTLIQSLSSICRKMAERE